MRVREWYGWHFPELSKLVVDDVTYCRVVLAVRNRARLSEPGASAEIEAAVGGDAEMRDAIRSAGELSMGTDVSEEDITNIVELAERVSIFLCICVVVVVSRSLPSPFMIDFFPQRHNY